MFHLKNTRARPGDLTNSLRLTPPKVHNTCRPRSPAHEGTGAASIEGASACLTNRAAASALSLVGGACTVKSQ